MLLKPHVHVLAESGDIRALIRATRHWVAGVRVDAVAALGALRADDAASSLIRALSDAQSEVREAAARALGDVECQDAVEPLIAALRAINGIRNDRSGALEFEFAAIAEALGRIDDPRGITAVLESGTVCFHEGVFSVGRPHVGGLCLSGGARARAALLGIIEKHYLYEPYSLTGIVEALDYLRERRISALLIEILNSCVESMRTAWQVAGSPFETSDRNVESLALATARALARLDTKRAEPVLIDLLLQLPARSLVACGASAEAAPPNGTPQPLFPDGGIAFTDMRHAILTLRGEKSPAEFDCARSFLPLHRYKARRYKTDVEFGGEKHRTQW